MTRHQKKLKAEAESYGHTDVWPEVVKKGHIHLHCTNPFGRRKYLTTGSTPSDVRGMKHHTAMVKRWAKNIDY